MIRKIVVLFNKIVQIITFKKVVIWTLTGAIGIISYTIYENSKAIFTVMVGEPIKYGDVRVFSISDATKATINKFVNDNVIVTSAIILNVDIRHNQRTPVYWYSADVMVQRALDARYIDRIVRIPVFSSNEKNNAEIVSTLNGEFICNKSTDVHSVAVDNDLSNTNLYSCYISIPPYYGQFSGYMMITLKTLIPTVAMLDTLKLEMTAVATEIYQRNIQPPMTRGRK